MNSKPLKWMRSEDGNTASHCGRFCIDALYGGNAERPYAFELYEHDHWFARQIRRGRFTLQRDAKVKAERLVAEEKS